MEEECCVREPPAKRPGSPSAFSCANRRQELQARQWDEKIENDIKAGKLDKHASKWRADYLAGKFTDL